MRAASRLVCAPACLPTIPAPGRLTEENSWPVPSRPHRPSFPPTTSSSSSTRRCERGDIERLMGLWSDDDEICCIHPGGARLVGAAAIRASFEAMFGNGTIDAEPHRVRRLESHSSAVHSVLERIRVMTPRGRAVRLGRRDQRLPEVVAGLAPGRPPRQPGHVGRGAGQPRGRVDAALTTASLADERFPRAALAARRPCADDLAGVLQPPLRRRARRSSGASAGPTPDGDFIDVDWQGEDAAAPLLVLFHGLEGSSSSHYAQAFAAEARRRGWRFAVPHFRGCSGEINLAPRAYHSGDHEEVGWMLARFRALHAGPIVAVGVSLGGNALLRFAEEAGASAGRRACAPSPPSRRRSTSPPAAARSAAASAARSTRACSCAR